MKVYTFLAGKNKSNMPDLEKRFIKIGHCFLVQDTLADCVVFVLKATEWMEKSGFKKAFYIKRRHRFLTPLGFESQGKKGFFLTLKLSPKSRSKIMAKNTKNIVKKQQSQSEVSVIETKAREMAEQLFQEAVQKVLRAYPVYIDNLSFDLFLEDDDEKDQELLKEEKIVKSITKKKEKKETRQETRPEEASKVVRKVASSLCKEAKQELKALAVQVQEAQDMPIDKRPKARLKALKAVIKALDKANEVWDHPDFRALARKARCSLRWHERRTTAE